MPSFHIYKKDKNGHFILDCFGSDLSKMDQTGSNLISDEIIIEIYHQIFNFIYFLIKMDQNGSNLIKLDFWWNNHWNISSDFQLYLFFDQIESDLSKWIRMDQIGSKWIKTDQTWSYQISDEIINEIYCQIFNFISCLIRFNQICPKWIKLDQNVSSDFQIYLFFDQNGSDLSKMDQTWSNWISDEIIIEIYYQIFNFIYFLIILNQICQNGSKWIKLEQIRFLMK